jgi:hypothetical protein
MHMTLHLLLDETPWLHSNDPDGSHHCVEYKLTPEVCKHFLKEQVPDVYLDATAFLTDLEVMAPSSPLRQFVAEQIQMWLELR